MESLSLLLPSHWPTQIRDVLCAHPGLEALLAPKTRSAGSLRMLREATSSLAPDAPGIQTPASLRLFHALMFYAADALDDAHGIFQNSDTFLGSYGHGMMHRREGDFWNANYWFRHAGTPPAGLFSAGFNPAHLTNRCEKHVTARPSEQAPLLAELREEWVLLVDALLEGRLE